MVELLISKSNRFCLTLNPSLCPSDYLCNVLTKQFHYTLIFNVIFMPFLTSYNISYGRAMCAPRWKCFYGGSPFPLKLMSCLKNMVSSSAFTTFEMYITSVQNYTQWNSLMVLGSSYHPRHSNSFKKMALNCYFHFFLGHYIAPVQEYTCSVWLKL